VDFVLKVKTGPEAMEHITYPILGNRKASGSLLKVVDVRSHCGLRFVVALQVEVEGLKSISTFELHPDAVEDLRGGS
jgi:hypothetical protein